MLTRTKKLALGGLLAGIGAVALGGAALYYTMAPKDTPAPVSLSGVAQSLTTTPSSAALDGAALTAATDTLAGTWVLATDSESFVGYRVKEQLATVGTFTAVGRTKSLSATMTYDGSAITAVQVSADLTGLTSDNPMRDGQLRQQALETNRYPTATFTLTQPIALSSVPAAGETVTATAVGDLTLHGVTRSISIPLQGQFSNNRAVVVGTLELVFADYGIQKPSAAMVLGVDDRGVLELQLVFQPQNDA